MGIDTSTDVLNLAIVENGKMIVDYKIQKEGLTHSSIIINALKDILDIADLSLEALEGIAVSIGPGSFTGLRIGLATAKGLAFSLSLPITGINCLESYALGRIDLPGILCPMIKARKDEYYFTLYQKTNMDELVRMNQYQCHRWFVIKEKLLALYQSVYIFGYGLREIIKNEKGKTNLKNIHLIIREQDPPGAANIAFIGEKKISRKQADDIFKLIPFYIRKSAAEIKYKENNSFQKGI